MGDLTLVTCWWDLEARGAEKGRRNFAELGKPVLALPIPMVIFCDPWVADIIREGRVGVQASTTMITPRLEDLSYFNRWSERVKQCELPGNRNKPKDSHTLVAMGWSKPGMLAEVAANNPYHTSHVGWIDLGIYHALSYEGSRSNSSLDILTTFKPKDPRVNLHILRSVGTLPETSNYYHNIWCLVAAGFMVGSCPNVIEFANNFVAEAERVIAGGHVSIDEDLLAALVNKNPNNYTYSYGNYCDIISNYGSLTTNANYLLWMCKDARERGDHKFADDLERQIIESWSTKKLNCPNDIIIKLIRSARDRSQWAWICQVIASLDIERLLQIQDAQLLEAILMEGFIAAYWINKEYAKEIIDTYHNLVDKSPKFREAFLANKELAERNFSFLK